VRRPPLLALLAALACGGDDERPLEWRYIHAAIILPNCATSSCHSALSKKSGVNLEDPDLARDQFMSGALSNVQGLANVRQMPPDEPLPKADIDLLERWFLQETGLD
jgi:hypothetical protein